MLVEYPFPEQTEVITTLTLSWMASIYLPIPGDTFFGRCDIQSNELQLCLLSKSSDGNGTSNQDRFLTYAYGMFLPLSRMVIKRTQILQHIN